MFEQVSTAKGAASFFNSDYWTTYLAVVGISIWGGVTHYMNNSTEAFSWARLFANLLSSSFAGMMVFLSCQYAGISGPLVGVLCGVASHLGTPALIQIAMRLKVVRNLLETETK